MGKEGGMTPKAIANRIKAKGLQKLKWYCQICEKQCRDENGFKCHKDSEPHKRQMEIFAKRSSHMIHQYSKDFESDFMRLLSRRYPSAKVSANQVYNEFIKDRDHVHMNSTHWTTLSEFVQYLGKNGKCEVEDTPKGWFIKFINVDPDYLMRKEIEKKHNSKLEITQEEREKRDIDKKIKEMNKIFGESQVIAPTEVDKDLLGKLSIGLSKPQTTTTTTTTTTTSTTSTSTNNEEKKNIFEKESISFSLNSNNNNNRNNSNNEDKPYSKKKSSALDEIIIREQMMQDKKRELLKKEQEQQHQQQQKQQDENQEKGWIIKDIVVKIIDKELGKGKYYKQKGYILSLESEFVAKIKLLESGEVLKIDQTYLETVIPSIGCDVVLLKYPYRGEIAKLVKLNIDDFNADLSFDNDDNNVLKNISYEDFSKLN